MEVLTCASVANSISEASKARNNKYFSNDLTITPTIEKVKKIYVPKPNLYEEQEYIHCEKCNLKIYHTRYNLHTYKNKHAVHCNKNGDKFIQCKCSYVLLETNYEFHLKSKLHDKNIKFLADKIT